MASFWGVSTNNCWHGNTFEDFSILIFLGVPQPKPMHGFPPNIRDMFTPRGSRAD